MDEFLHGTLLLQAFEKAAAELFRTTGVKPSVSAASRWLSDYIDRVQQFPFGDKSLRDYRNKALTGKSVVIKQPEVLAALAKLMGYSDFAEFYQQHQKASLPNNLEKPVPDKAPLHRKRRFIRIVITIGFSLLLAIWGSWYWSSHWGPKKKKPPTERQMVWKETHYELVLEGERLPEGTSAIPYDEALLQHLKKKHADSIDFFFDNHGDPLIWYGKNRQGEYEYFTQFAKHPETGKYLKPITHYMINKYILPQRLKDTLEN